MPQELEVEVKTALTKISDEIKDIGEKAIAEAKKGIQLGESAKERIDELLMKQGELMTRQDDLEQKAARRGTEHAQIEQTLGQQFVEQDGYKEFAAQKGKKNFHMDVKAVTTVTSATTGTGAGGAAVRADRIVSPMMTPGQRRMTIRDLLAGGRTASNLIEYVQETGFQNMAAIQAEGALKAQSDIAFALINSPVVTIAHWVKASKQILDDAPMMESYIDGRLRYGLEYAEELQLLMGSGSAGNLNGVYTQATAYAAPTGALVGTATIIDIIRLAMLQAELAEYPTDGTILNPTQWAAMELLKDSQGRYIIGNPQGTTAPTLWNRPVVATQAMTTDKFLVGSFKMGAQVFDREDANVQVSTEDSDNFVKNLVTIRAEERLGLAVYRPEAFIKGDLGLIP